jgi:hypothetical protein
LSFTFPNGFKMESPTSNLNLTTESLYSIHWKESSHRDSPMEFWSILSGVRFDKNQPQCEINL